MRISRILRSKEKNILVFGKRNKNIEWLEHLFTDYFYKVCLVLDLAEAIELLTDVHFDVILVTDSLEDKLNKDFFSDLRKIFPHAKVLCLVDKITQQKERALRSTGLVYLGSYDHFYSAYQDILKSALKNE